MATLHANVIHHEQLAPQCIPDATGLCGTIVVRGRDKVAKLQCVVYYLTPQASRLR